MGAEDTKRVTHSCQGGPTGLAKTDIYTGGYSVENETAETGRGIMGAQRKCTFLSLGCLFWGWK